MLVGVGVGAVDIGLGLGLVAGPVGAGSAVCCGLGHWGRELGGWGDWRWCGVGGVRAQPEPGPTAVNAMGYPRPWIEVRRLTRHIQMNRWVGLFHLSIADSRRSIPERDELWYFGSDTTTQRVTRRQLEISMHARLDGSK